LSHFCLLMPRRPPGSPPFPYTTLFRSAVSPVLWERYGDQYRGLLVELDPQDDNLKAAIYQGKPQLLQAVHYDDERPVKDPKQRLDRKSTRLNSSHVKISYAVFCLKKKK